ELDRILFPAKRQVAAGLLVARGRTQRAGEGKIMILNDEELKVVREQLSLIEDALASLRRRVTNERNLAVYSEGYVDQIAELKAEIAKYERAAKKEPANGKAKSAKKPAPARRKKAAP